MKNIKLLIATSGFLAVVMGAFGEHALKPLLSDYQRMIYEKAVIYQFVHTLAAMIALQHDYAFYRYAAVSFVIGNLLFSGSLYGLATAHLTALPTLFLGPLTPIGGVLFLVGWALLFVAILYYEKS